jgi:hypothetical protein
MSDRETGAKQLHLQAVNGIWIEGYYSTFWGCDWAAAIQRHSLIRVILVGRGRVKTLNTGVHGVSRGKALTW